MHLETLAPETSAILQILKIKSWLSSFYLAGGTALALQYGHRQSVDLDWFTPKNIKTSTLAKKLSLIGNFTVIQEEENTLEEILNEVKMSFMSYPYPLLKKAAPFDGRIVLATPLDIAIMKVQAVSGRNTKKDFIDLYIFLHHEQMKLETLLAHMKRNTPERRTTSTTYTSP